MIVRTYDGHIVSWYGIPNVIFLCEKSVTRHGFSELTLNKDGVHTASCEQCIARYVSYKLNNGESYFTDVFAIKGKK